MTATDSDANTGTQDIAVKVNGPPTAAGTINTVTVNLGSGTTDVDVSNKFSDPNSDTLTYTAASSDTDVATVSVSGSTVSITPVAVGSATVTVTASDGSLTGTQTIAVTVTNRPPVAVGTIAPVTVHLGAGATNVDVSSKFVDPDSHTLTYTAVSSDTNKATVSCVRVYRLNYRSGVRGGDGDGHSNRYRGGDRPANHRCDGAQPPAGTKVGTIDAVTVRVGGSAAGVDVSSKFSDPEGHTLTYTAESSDTNKATVSVSGSTVSITPVAVGTATVTVTATDTEGGTAQQTIAVTVSNRAPTAVGTIAAVTVNVGDSGNSVNVSGNFSDPDNDTLTYTAKSSDTSKVTVSVSGSVVTITPVAVGGATVTVTANDGNGGTAQQTIAVTVPNRAPVATLADY